MQKIVTIVALICATAFQVNAQENRNQTYNITLGNVQYAHHDEKMSAGEAIGKVLTGLATGQVSVQATKYEGDVKNAIIKGLSGAYRFHYNDGLQTGDLAKEGNIVARVDPRTASRAGNKIKIALDTNRLHFFDKDTEKTILNK